MTAPALPSQSEMAELAELPPVSRAARFRLYAAGTTLVVLLAAGLVIVREVGARATHGERVRRQELASRGPRALVTPALTGAAERRLVLQAEAKPFRSVVVYAKVSGYLRELHVDRGDKVHEGDVLAVVASPELERQWQAAQADAVFKRANARRLKGLPAAGLVAERDVERDESAAQVAEAQAASLEVQRGYTVLRAPFSGTITARFADAGALVQSATSAQSGALPVVTVSQVDRLRVFAYVDQKDAPAVRRGGPALLSTTDGAPLLEATVSRVSGELEPRTRTMLVEIDVDNRDGRLLAGSFLNVTLTVKAPSRVEIPAEALVVRDQKPFVGVVDDTNRVRLRAVAIASHDGQRIGLASGLREGELVALNLGRALVDGDLIEPVRVQR